jgi:hypothetical protein
MKALEFAAIGLYVVGTLADWYTTKQGAKYGYVPRNEQNKVSKWLMEQVGVWFATLVPELTILTVVVLWAPTSILVAVCLAGGIGQLAAAVHNYRVLQRAGHV